jgi:hypothetical protein
MTSEAYTDLRLLVNELVVDALQPRPSESGREIEVRAEMRDGAVRVELTQGSSAYRLPSRQPEPGAPGWGVHLALRLAQRWGLRRERGRATVWWEMPGDQRRL